MPDTRAERTREIWDSLQKGYQDDVFHKAGLKVIAAYEDGFTKAAAETPHFKALYDVELIHLSRARSHLPNIAREAASFLIAVDQAQYADAIEELDVDLARRELNFAKMLIGAVYENYLLARLQRARGRVSDIKFALSADAISRSCLIVGQLTGNDGYLTSSPNITLMHNWSSQIGNNLARSMIEEFRSARRGVLDSIVRFLPRYALDFVRRNIVRVLISFGVFVWLFALIAEVEQLSVWGIGSLLLIVSALCTLIFEKTFKRRWLEIHRRAVRGGAIQLYIWFLHFLPQRAILDAMHEMSDEERLRELFPSADPAPMEPDASENSTLINSKNQ